MVSHLKSPDPTAWELWFLKFPLWTYSQLLPVFILPLSVKSQWPLIHWKFYVTMNVQYPYSWVKAHWRIGGKQTKQNASIRIKDTSFSLLSIYYIFPPFSRFLAPWLKLAWFPHSCILPACGTSTTWKVPSSHAGFRYYLVLFHHSCSGFCTPVRKPGEIVSVGNSVGKGCPEGSLCLEALLLYEFAILCAEGFPAWGPQGSFLDVCAKRKVSS